MRWLARGVLAALLFAVLGVFGLGIVSSAHASALPASVKTFAATADSGGGGGDCKKTPLLGVFVPWYQYLKLEKDGSGSCNIQDFTLLPKNKQSSDVPLVLLAIVDDLLRFAGLAAVIFVVYGGIQYATSQGSPEATAKAQSTVLNALIGLAIVLVAVTFVSFLGRALT